VADRALTRRRFLTSAVTVTSAAALGGFVGFEAATRPAIGGVDAAAAGPAVVPFDGAHQAGIVTPAQDRLAFAAFDLTTTKRSDLVELLRTWTAAARLMTTWGGSRSPPGQAHVDAGLFFICFQRDPRRQFVPIQARLAANDALGEYIRHTSSALFACPPGTRPGGSWGDTLFADG
jgi:deferrochelatase/peroxidase EfeB